MTRSRKSAHSLTGTRIYIRRGNYRYESSEQILNPQSGKLQKSHFLCKLSEGEAKAREAKEKLLGATQAKGRGDFGAWMEKYEVAHLKKRELKAPSDPARQNTWSKGALNIKSALKIIKEYFAEFDVEQVQVALVHSDLATTKTYIRGQDTPVSAVSIGLPKR